MTTKSIEPAAPAQRIEPFVWLQLHGDHRNANQLDGRVIVDARSFIRRELDKVVSAGYPGVLLHCAGGVRTHGVEKPKGYAADQRMLLQEPGVPKQVYEYFEHEYARDLCERSLTGLVYLGMTWQSEIERVQAMHDGRGGDFSDWPLISDDDVQRFEREIVWWKDHGGSGRIFFDALARRAETSQGWLASLRLKRLLEKYGMQIGGEPLPLTSGGTGGVWRMDWERALDFPTLVTEHALFRMANNDAYRVPRNAVVYTVMRPQEATASRIRRRQQQGFLPMPWNDVPIAVMRSMLKYSAARADAAKGGGA